MQPVAVSLLPLRLSLALMSAVAVAVCCLFSAPCGAQSLNQGEAVEYTVSMAGVTDETVREALLAVSEAAKLTDRPPPSIRLLERRAARDVETFSGALDSYGYFKAKVSYVLDQDQTPLTLRYEVEPGPRFNVAEVKISAVPGRSAPDLPTPAQIGLEPGEAYAARSVIDAESRLLSHLGVRGRPFPKVAKRTVTADFEVNAVRVAFQVAPGPRAAFGQTRITGLNTVDEAYARTFIPWSPGQTFDVSLLGRARRALFESGLFAKVTVDHAGELTDGSLPMTVTVAERDHRTARAGLTFSTDFGPGANFGWEHRNYLGKGEALRADLSVNAVKRSLDASLSKPRFMGAEQELVVKTSLADEDSDAFTSRGLDVSAIVERDVRGLFSVGYGGGYRYTRVKDEDEEETDNFGHAYVPLAVARDKRDSVLDPSRGYRVNVQAAPFLDTLGSGANFLIYRLSGSLYHELLDERRAVLAARAMFGAITGADREQVPADLRLYAGGGGTVRGYAYQSAGELDEDDEPVGGKSMISAGLEARFKISENMGFSPFLDVGRAYEQGQPDLEEELFWGAGVGFQYYTGFGPVRVDAAVPLNPRGGVDDPFQIYVSLGQSF